jgi:hypothetical protein
MDRIWLSAAVGSPPWCQVKFSMAVRDTLTSLMSMSSRSRAIFRAPAIVQPRPLPGRGRGKPSQDRHHPSAYRVGFAQGTPSRENRLHVWAATSGGYEN